MAVTQSDKTKTLQVQINKGSTLNPSYKTLSFNNLSPNAEDELVKGLGDRIAKCQQHSLEAIYSVDKGTLVEE